MNHTEPERLLSGRLGGKIMNEQKRLYVERLADQMRSAGQHNWLPYDIQDLCELAGLHDEYVRTESREKDELLAMKAAKILNVTICHI